MKAKAKRLFHGTICLILTVCLLVQGNVPFVTAATESPDSSTVQVSGNLVTDAETGSPTTTNSQLRDYSMPNNSKHAYDPFAQLETEEETKAYRESVQYEAGTIIYKVTETKGVFSKDYTSEAEESALTQIGIDVSTATELSRKEVEDGLLKDTYEVIYQADLDGDVWETVDALAETDGVVAAQPNYLYEDTAVGVPTISHDPNMGQQWHHDYLHAHDRWNDLYKENITAGEGAVVAVIDTGVDYTHPDLAASMWVNTAEFKGTPGVDDDGNGYVDDIYGVSTVGATPFHSGDPMDDHGHGTHVAGIIAMTAGNDEGGVGLAYGTKIMAIKAGQATGVFSDTDIAEAINYAVAMGADVINMSFGGYGQSFLVEEALADAFGSCVLVAAAGNDGIPTSDAPEEFMKKADTYPAGYSFVLGVMASDANGNLASFSNWDYYNNGGSAEYELTAPGVDIYSTLPGGQYAAWDGTSMAAPLVSAAAALLRSKYSDKDLYSSRFIMGQLASATEDTLTYVDKINESHIYAALNLEDSLNKLPKPNLTVKNTYLFDDPAIDPANDGDGIIDAGETIDLGLVLRNQWGMAGDVIVTVDALSTGGIANPNIEFITNSITMDDVGTFNEQNNSFVYEENMLVGTANPIRFKVKSDTINDANIGLNITVTCTNGLDKTDTTVYTYAPNGYELSFYVQRGRTISGTIKEDMVWDADNYWIVENSVYIPEGVTVTVEPGTQIQFWGSDANDPYVAQAIAYIMVDGEFLVNGTEEAPVDMFPSAAYSDYGVDIFDGERGTGNAPNEGTICLQYANIMNPFLEIDKGEHLNILQNSTSLFVRDTEYTGNVATHVAGGRICIRDLLDSKINGLSGASMVGEVAGVFDNVLLNNCKNIIGGGELTSVKNTTFLNTQGMLSYVGNSFTKEPVEFSDVFTFGNKKYVVANIPQPPLTAYSYYAYCAISASAKGGTLACFNSEEEEKAVKEFISTTSSEGCWLYFGLRADSKTGELYWLDGSNEYFPSDVESYRDGYEYYSYGHIYVSSDYSRFSMDATGFNSSSVIFEFPATMSDEEITTPLTAEQYFAADDTGITNSAILNPMLTQSQNEWLKIGTTTIKDLHFNGVNNYWGTTNEKLIQTQVLDQGTYVNYADLVTDPYLTLESPELETIYPFVTEAYITDMDGNRITSCGFEEIQVHVTFNRDMDTDAQPMVSYGPAEPYTDYVVDGDWVSARHWVGTTKVTPIIDSGTEYIRVKDATAADDAWLTTGTDVGRFAFTISNTGAAALTMQAVGEENKVELSWTQDDYDTLAGFNIYRSASADGTFEKINTRLIPGTIRTYTDTDVEPGVEYYYYFTVIGTDLLESNPSNTAAATPLDNIKPVLTHNRVTDANYGESISFTATASDNIGVTYVKLYYRAKGTIAWKSVDMTNMNGNSYYVAIAAKDVAMAGMEYYIEVSDGTSIVRDGSAQYPVAIAVDSTMVIYSVSPSKVDIAAAEAGVTAVVTGVNFSETMKLQIAGKEVAYTFVNDKQITFTVPVGTVGRADIVLTDGQRSATLTNAITYTDNTSEVQIVAPGDAKAKEAIRLPITVNASGAVYGVDMQLKLATYLYSDIQFETSESCASAMASCTANWDDTVKLSIASASAMPTDGPIGYLVLTPNDVSESLRTSVQITSAQINAVSVSTLVDCNLVIQPNFSISGRVTYYNTDEGIAGVKMTLSDGMVTYTDADGYYTFTGITTGSVVVTPELSGIVNGAITSQDAALVLQTITDDTTTLSEMQMIAADVDGDGQLTSMDASYIMQKTVGMIEGTYPGSGAEWTFSEAAKVLTMAQSMTDVNFTGILLGDVTGDWTSTPVENLE